MKFLIAFFLFSSCFILHAQNNKSKTKDSFINFFDKKDSITHQNYIEFKPFQLLFRELILEYERPINQKWGYGLGIAYRFDRNHVPEFSGGSTGLFGAYQFQNMFNPHYKALYFCISPKRYFDGNKFLSLDIFYRYWWCDNKYIIFNNVEGYRFNAIRTDKVSVYGLKILFNSRQRLYKFTTNFESIITLYAGLGYRFRTYQYESVGGTINDRPNIYKKENGQEHLPSIHIGLKLGFGFN
jgi:hypothetical protein